MLCKEYKNFLCTVLCQQVKFLAHSWCSFNDFELNLLENSFIKILTCHIFHLFKLYHLMTSYIHSYANVTINNLRTLSSPPKRNLVPISNHSPFLPPISPWWPVTTLLSLELPALYMSYKWSCTAVGLL